jgi:hypothetical protein
MYEIGNNPNLTATVQWHSFDLLRKERTILSRSSTDDEITVQGKAADDINATIQAGAHAGLYMFR